MRGIFTGLLKYLSRNMAISVQKSGGKNQVSKFVSGYFKTKNIKKNTSVIKLIKLIKKITFLLRLSIAVLNVWLILLELINFM